MKRALDPVETSAARLLRDQVALITGAATGIGLALATVLAAEGATVVLLDVDDERGVAVAERISATGAVAAFMPADVSDPSAVYGAVQATVRRYGRVDVVVNNAAIFTRASIDEVTFDDWRRVIGVNLDGTFHVVKAVLPHMVRAGHGKIFNVASGLGITGGVRAAAYATSKAAVIGFTKCVAREYASFGISANTVVPGLTDTEMPRRSQSAADVDAMVAQIPMARLAAPEEIARFVALLASPSCTYVTGQTLIVNGGWIMP